MGVRHAGVASGTTPPPTHADTLSPTRARTNRARRRAPRGLGREERASPGGNHGGHATVPWPPPALPPARSSVADSAAHRHYSAHPHKEDLHRGAASHVGVFCLSRSFLCLSASLSYLFPSDGGLSCWCLLFISFFAFLLLFLIPIRRRPRWYPTRVPNAARRRATSWRGGAEQGEGGHPPPLSRRREPLHFPPTGPRRADAPIWRSRHHYSHSALGCRRLGGRAREEGAAA